MRWSQSQVCKAFTLVELMVVLVIISILGTFAVPTVQRVQRKARTAAVVNDFRVFASVFQAYAQETGAWPSDSAAGAVPRELRTGGQLSVTAWTRTTPIGGKYNWERNRNHIGVRYAAAISISGTGAAPLRFDLAQFEDIDAAIDDGDLTSGNFRLGAGNVPLFVIQR